MDNRYYVYIFLDPKKPGLWRYKEYTFYYKPFYIGKGLGNRIKHHLMPCCLKNNRLKTNIIKSIVLSGHEPIYFKLYQNLANEEALKLEIELISYFGRKDIKTGILSNHTPGGESCNIDKNKKPVWKYDLDGNFINKYDSISDAAKEINFIKYSNIIPNISYVAKKCKIAHNFIWSNKYLGKNIPAQKRTLNYKIKVYQYDLDGNFIQEFPSRTTAANKLGIKGIRWFTDKGVQSYGFMWFPNYMGNKVMPFKPNEIPKKRYYTYNQIDNYGIVLNKFDSAVDARKKLKIIDEKAPSKIIDCAAGRLKIAFGFKWSRTPYLETVCV